MERASISRTKQTRDRIEFVCSHSFKSCQQERVLYILNKFSNIVLFFLKTFCLFIFLEKNIFEKLAPNVSGVDAASVVYSLTHI